MCHAGCGGRGALRTQFRAAPRCPCRLGLGPVHRPFFRYGRRVGRQARPYQAQSDPLFRHCPAHRGNATHPRSGRPAEPLCLGSDRERPALSGLCGMDVTGRRRMGPCRPSRTLWCDRIPACRWSDRRHRPFKRKDRGQRLVSVLLSLCACRSRLFGEPRLSAFLRSGGLGARGRRVPALSRAASVVIKEAPLRVDYRTGALVGGIGTSTNRTDDSGDDILGTPAAPQHVPVFNLFPPRALGPVSRSHVRRVMLLLRWRKCCVSAFADKIDMVPSGPAWT